MHNIRKFDTSKHLSPSLRGMKWIEEQTFEGWGCSKCIWVFHPFGLPIGESLDQMKRNFQIQLADAFASHDCVERARAKAAKLPS